MATFDDDVGLRMRLKRSSEPESGSDGALRALVPAHRLDAGHVLHADRYWKPKFWRRTQPGTPDHRRLFADIRPNQRTPERNALSRFILNFKRGYESAGHEVDIHELVRAVNIAFPAAECTFDLASQAVHSKKSRLPPAPATARSAENLSTPSRTSEDNAAMHALLEVIRDDLERRGGRDPSSPTLMEFSSITGERCRTDTSPIY